MTDAQLGVLIAALGALGGVIRWAVNRITKSNDDGTAALVANTAQLAAFIVKIDNFGRQIERLDDFVKEEISGVHDGPPRPGQRYPTPRGVRIPRRGSHHDGED